MKLLFLAVLLCVAAHSASAANFYVSPQGNDANSGSKLKPWRTVQEACNRAVPGAVVHVAAGIYREKITVRVQGTAAGGYITLQGAPGAIISGAGRPRKHLILIENKSYLKITGFELRDNLNVRDGSAIRLEGSGSHLELRGNKIHNITGRDAMGITVYGTSARTPFSHLMIEGNEIYDCQPAPSEALTLNGNISGFQIKGNWIHDVNNIGIDMIGGEGICPKRDNDAARGGVCRLNRVERARSNYGGGYGAGIYVDGGRDIIIERNTVSQSDLGIEIGCENAGFITTNVIVRNNLIYNNDKAGLVFGGYDTSTGRVENCRFLGNTLFQNDTLNDGNGELWIQFASNNVVKNNIFVASRGSRLLSVAKGATANSLDYNLWFAPNGKAVFSWRDREIRDFAAYQKITRQDSHSQQSNPQFRSPKNRDFRPQSTSPALNSGDPSFISGADETDFLGRSRIQGRRVDQGAIEMASAF